MVAIRYDPYENMAFDDEELVHSFDIKAFIAREYEWFLDTIAMMERVQEVRPEGTRVRNQSLTRLRRQLEMMRLKFDWIDPDQELVLNLYKDRVEVISAKKAHRVKDAGLTDAVVNHTRDGLVLLVTVARRRWDQKLNKSDLNPRAEKSIANKMALTLETTMVLFMEIAKDVWREGGLDGQK